ncbi:hypothetical protein BGW36DRAFT_422152 [Talaromyces proteolyticus]|uniref:Uncharacterized protein n=1 Tax=Talaromyces proteolyticus TaxID=1131652 RepID=A0AAD4L133_9EURO|nr:uncharacterized protein BGW36DRAFT_422152 [Talaromyces proteolyticus]KAH8705602.1 hypothetical protein BGW36DRAFT_422152 [Talaromyces proteolyticus]
MSGKTEGRGNNGGSVPDRMRSRGGEGAIVTAGREAALEQTGARGRNHRRFQFDGSSILVVVFKTKRVGAMGRCDRWSMMDPHSERGQREKRDDGPMYRQKKCQDENERQRQAREAQEKEGERVADERRGEERGESEQAWQVVTLVRRSVVTRDCRGRKGTLGVEDRRAVVVMEEDGKMEGAASSKQQAGS